MKDEDKIIAVLGDTAEGTVVAEDTKCVFVGWPPKPWFRTSRSDEEGRPVFTDKESDDDRIF